jgi:hypothetical protein
VGLSRHNIPVLRSREGILPQTLLLLPQAPKKVKALSTLTSTHSLKWPCGMKCDRRPTLACTRRAADVPYEQENIVGCDRICAILSPYAPGGKVHVVTTHFFAML